VSLILLELEIRAQFAAANESMCFELSGWLWAYNCKKETNVRRRNLKISTFKSKTSFWNSEIQESVQFGHRTGKRQAFKRSFFTNYDVI
jgi:hypothetical protein